MQANTKTFLLTVAIITTGCLASSSALGKDYVRIQEQRRRMGITPAETPRPRADVDVSRRGAPERERERGRRIWRHERDHADPWLTEVLKGSRGRGF